MKNYNNYILENKKESTLAHKIEQEYLLMQLDDNIDDSKIRKLIDLNIEYSHRDISDGIEIRFEMKYFEDLFGFSADHVEDYESIRDDNYYNFTLEEMYWDDLMKIKSYNEIKKLFNLSDGVLFRFLEDVAPELKTQFIDYRDTINEMYSENVFNNFQKNEDELPYLIKMSSDYSEIILVFYYEKMKNFKATTIKELLIESKPLSNEIRTIHIPHFSKNEEAELIDKIEPLFDEIYKYMKENKTEILNNIDIDNFITLHMIGGDFWNHLNTYEYQDNFINHSYSNYKILIDKQGVGLGKTAFKIDDKIKEKYKHLKNMDKYKI